MKTKNDPRHLRRIKLTKFLYSFQFGQSAGQKLKPVEQKTADKILKNLKEINRQIDYFSARFGVDRMSKIDLSILQLGVYEMLFVKNIPKKVIIDEAVELAKEFGGSKSPALINGILAKIMEKQNEGTNK
jgi:N utilization substance protein B